MICTIHRGSRQIGGSCIELASDGSRILLDFGLPLDEPDAEPANLAAQSPDQSLLPINGVYEDAPPGFDGILLSHAHPDHHGLLGYVHPEIPVFANAETQTLLAIGAYFQPEAKPVRNLRTIAAGEPFEVGAFWVTPYLMDHSAYGALAFLVEAEGKKVFYSGDFRGHGRKRTVFQRLLATPPETVDALILEGTALGQVETGLHSEVAVQREMERLFRQRRDLTFVAFSSQNADRVVSIYKACLRTGKLFIIDPYTAYVLYQLGGQLPQYDYQNVRIYFAPGAHTKRLAENGDLFCFKDAKISFQEILRQRDRVVIKNTYAVREKFTRTETLTGAALIYSQWWGYFENERDFWSAHGIEPVPVHASGHAHVADLQALAQALHPRRIIPVHTRYPESYQRCFGESVVVLRDGQPLEI